MAYGELLDRLTFYGLITVLTLYLTKSLHFTDNHLYEIWGLTTSLGFGLPVLGGLLADRLLGFRFAINLGCILIITGCLVLSVAGLIELYVGLSLVVLGIGFYKGNVTSVISLLYHNEDKNRESGFLVFYVWMVTGAILGPIIYGMLSEIVGFKAGFILSAVAFSSFCFLFNKNYVLFEFKQEVRQLSRSQFFLLNNTHKLFLCVTIILIVSIITIMFLTSYISNYIVLVLSVFIFFLIFFSVWKKNIKYRKRICIIAIISLLNAVYFSAGLQVDGSLILYISRNTHFEIFNKQLPPAFFSSLEPFLSVLCAGSFMFIWNKIKISNLNLNMILLIILGLFLTSIGFQLFSFGASLSNSFMWTILSALIIGNLMIALSGICILPTLMSSVTRLAPKEYLGTLVGMKFMLNSAAGIVSAYVANLTNIGSQNKGSHIGFDVTFHKVAIFMFSLAIISLIFIPIIKWLSIERR